jgi:hypothetical protein
MSQPHPTTSERITGWLSWDSSRNVVHARSLGDFPVFPCWGAPLGKVAVMLSVAMDSMRWLLDAGVLLSFLFNTPHLQHFFWMIN